MDNSDKSLLAAHMGGDEAAFEMIVRRYGDSLLGYLVKMTGNRDQAQDLFQETFRKVHEKAHTFRGDQFKSWLFTIATRVAIDSYRKNSRVRVMSLNQEICSDGVNCGELGETVAATDCEEPADEAIRGEQVMQVRNAIGRLPEKQRATLVLAYYQHLSYREVAEVMDCSIGTVKRQMYRALRSLKSKLPDKVEVA